VDWVESTVPVYSPSLRADKNVPALRGSENGSIVYFGVNSQRAVFGYRPRGTFTEDVGFSGTRQPALDGHLGSIWMMDITRWSSRYSLSSQQIAGITQYITEALLSHPNWPHDYRDSPTVAVEFTTPD
jgi:hypothetical protein